MRDCLLANVSRRYWINCKRELSKGKMKLTLKKVRFDDINENLKLLRDGDIIDIIMILVGSTAMAECDTETRNKQAVHAAFDAWRNGTAGNVLICSFPTRTGRSLAI